MPSFFHPLLIPHISLTTPTSSLNFYIYLLHHILFLKFSYLQIPWISCLSTHLKTLNFFYCLRFYPTVYSYTISRVISLYTVISVLYSSTDILYENNTCSNLRDFHGFLILTGNLLTCNTHLFIKYYSIFTRGLIHDSTISWSCH